jgi:thiamine biosynthesis lipoprotein
MIAIGAKSATVIGPNGAIADALATALMVAGRDVEFGSQLQNYPSIQHG